MIVHITTQNNWELAKAQGEYTSPSLNTDGFIHCSTVRQAADTANLFFKGQTGLVLLCIDEKKLTAECRFEGPAGGGGNRHDPRNVTLFPHIYGPINNAAVFKVVDVPLNKSGEFEVPEELLTVH